MRSNRILEHDLVIAVQPQIIRAFGEKSARIIAQIHYLSLKEDFGKIYDGKKWVFNTYEYLAQTLCISLRHTKRLISMLAQEGVIQVKKLADYKSNRTNYYCLDYDRLSTLVPHIARTYLDDTMALSSCHDGTMVITNKTNINENTKSDAVGQGGEVKIMNQQVSNLDMKTSEVVEKPKTTTAQDMLTLWNKLIEKVPTQMSKTLAPMLVCAYKTKFNSDMNQWQTYCQKIASSPYLMGQGFELSLSWALKFSTIERILNNQWGVKDLPTPPENLDAKALAHIHSLTHEPALCLDVRYKLLRAYGAAMYISWIKDLEFSLAEGKVRFKAPTKFHEDYVLKLFNDILA